jgi:DnaJ-class molecular chaperone
MTDDRQAVQVDWNLPPGPTTTRCPECLGQGSVLVERSYAASDAVGTMRVPACCTGCRGRGSFPGMQPPV